MSPASLPLNTREAEQRYKTVSAPLLQFADGTLPSPTLENLTVEDTRFGANLNVQVPLKQYQKGTF
jgi:hypothetical protein